MISRGFYAGWRVDLIKAILFNVFGVFALDRTDRLLRQHGYRKWFIRSAEINDLNRIEPLADYILGFGAKLFAYTDNIYISQATYVYVYSYRRMGTMLYNVTTQKPHGHLFQKSGHLAKKWRFVATV